MKYLLFIATTIPLLGYAGEINLESIKSAKSCHYAWQIGGKTANGIVCAGGIMDRCAATVAFYDEDGIRMGSLVCNLRDGKIKYSSRPQKLFYDCKNNDANSKAKLIQGTVQGRLEAFKFDKAAADGQELNCTHNMFVTTSEKAANVTNAPVRIIKQAGDGIKKIFGKKDNKANDQNDSASQAADEAKKPE